MKPVLLVVAATLLAALGGCAVYPVEPSVSIYAAPGYSHGHHHGHGHGYYRGGRYWR